jgi:hypothetical protein
LHYFEIYSKKLNVNNLIKENQFSQNLMNSIGVDFKLKNLDLDGTRFKLQIVNKIKLIKSNIIFIFKYYNIVGYSRSRKIPNYYNKLLQRCSSYNYCL